MPAVKPSGVRSETGRAPELLLPPPREAVAMPVAAAALITGFATGA